MMKLLWSPRSPYVRKVMIVLHETGQVDQVTLHRALVALQLPPNPDVMPANPLGKIPTLITEDGNCLFDSRVIAEFLDMRAGTNLFPEDPTQRIAHLRWQSLADGLTDILLLWRTELTRPSLPWPEVVSGWQAKVRAAMSTLETEADKLAQGSFGIGQISVLCALGQLDFRWQDCNWREHFPKLAALEATWSDRPSAKQTALPPDQMIEGAEVTKGWLDFVHPEKN
jgi:glutathione S-transferase